jgi:hypothetical protein
MTVDELARLILLELTGEQRRELFERFGLLYPESLYRAKILIRDESDQYKNSPRATVHRENQTSETINIIASIREDPLSLGHPAILLAINRWVQIVRHYRAISKGTIALSDEEKELYATAKKQLKQVSKAILDAPKTHPLYIHDIFISFVESRYKLEYPYLYKAWEFLNDDEIKSIRNANLKVKRLRALLVETFKTCGYIGRPLIKPLPESHVEVFTRLHIDHIIDFITSQRLHLKRRKTWVAMRNAFWAWALGIESTSVQLYHNRALRSQRAILSGESFLHLQDNNGFEIHEVVDWLDLPVVLVK